MEHEASFTVLGARRVHVVRPVRRDPAPDSFVRELDLKLRRLQAGAAPADERPRFVTTVRAGQFLPPPPPLAALLGLHSLYPPLYQYSSRPQPVPPRPRARPAPAPGPGAVRALAAGVAHMTRLLHRPDGGAAPYSNVMHDKRVVRGSTFASHAHAAGDGAESGAARAARTRRRALARRAAAARLRPGTPPPAPGRRHRPLQTDRYLEELFDKGAELEVGVQTDLFVDRPASPAYVPAKTGADVATQILPGDLFDFDVEVQPVLEVLVGKTAEQALAEVAQEEELGALREQQRRYRELRDAERAERARLHAQHERLHGERERRVAEARGAREAAREARERAAAAALVHGYVADLLPAVLAGLRDHGHLLERVQTGVGEEFLPWLTAAAAAELEALLTSRGVLADIVRDVLDARAQLYAAGPSPPPSAPDSLTPPELEPEDEEQPAVTEDRRDVTEDQRDVTGARH